MYIMHYPIIPRPNKLIERKGFFILNEETCVKTSQECTKFVSYLKELVETPTGFTIDINSRDKVENTIEFLLNKNLALEKEGYHLNITEDKIVIKARESVGLFYGMQTLRQLLPPEIESNSPIEDIEWKIPCVSIEDYPRFKWRGHMLDVCRHFFGVDVVKKTLNLMALQKLNVFHWHLTEDQGWRIEIKKYPKLTDIGSKRADTQLKHSRSRKFRGKPHGGFYTQEEIREIVEYAKKRFITVVPEIEIPGHSQAAIAAYPELTCFGDNFEVASTFGVKKIIYCPGKDEVFKFWKDVLTEVMNLFPSEVIHIGGDEVPKDRWQECPDCQKLIKEKNLKNEEDLQVYVTNTMASFLAENGRRLMGWNEILDEGLEPNAICHYWAHSEKEVLKHIKMGRDMVNSKNKFTYLNYGYKGMPLEKVYSFDPVLEGLEGEELKHVLGLETPLWTEWIPDQKTLEFQAFPRIMALAEISWTSKENRDYTSFFQRLQAFEKRLDYLKVNYANEEERNPSLIARIRKLIRGK
ncbi:MAG: family 20 glycosylhydrolase [Candidatus Lokiarchaeota archaeon]|nr:family 20 glycosylhydrolase [Candidatus Lokiarchaeota archaeon]